MHIFFVFPFKEHSYAKILLLFPLQLYYDKIIELTRNKSGSVLFKQALVSLATDSGLHPLVPYFTYFIADEVILLLYLSYCLCLAYFWLRLFFLSHFELMCSQIHPRLHVI
jgi:hypothetical protein